MVYFIFISINVILLYLIIVLVSFSPMDPGWSQIEWSGSINNIGGVIGARVSDFLFFVFGVLAYVFPVLFLLYCWKMYLQGFHETLFTYLLRVIKLILLLCICCGLAHVYVDDILYFPSGGIIGNVLCDIVTFYYMRCSNVNIILLIVLIGFSMLCYLNQFFWVVCDVVIVRLFNFIIFILNSIRSMYRYMLCNNLYNVDADDCSCVVLKKKEFLNKYKDNRRYIKRKQFDCNPKVDNNFIICLDKLKRISCLFGNQDVTINKCKNNNIIPRIDLYFDLNQTIHKIDKKQQKILYEKIKGDDEKSNNAVSTTLIHEKETRKLYDSCIVRNCSMTQNNSIYDEKKDVVTVITNRKSKQSVVMSKDRCNSVIDRCNRGSDFKNNTGLPGIDLLVGSSIEKESDFVDLNKFSCLLELKLSEYRISANVVNIVPGPVITRFELNLSPGVKSSKIINVSRDLARSLLVTSVRVIEIIPGTPYVGLEIPNKTRKIVYLRDIIDSEEFKRIKNPLAVVLGRNVIGNPVIEDIKCMPHLLVSGTTGSGKSIGINAMIVSILYRAHPEEVRFIMIDPKILELSIYSGIPHLLKQVITDIQEVGVVLQWCVEEMERRYRLMAKFNVKNLEDYNIRIEELGYEKRVTVGFDTEKINNINGDNCVKKLPYIVVIVDEFSDLIMITAKKIEELIIRLTQKARASGIHVILATQRPSVDIITGLIKANIPARIAFTVSSKIDSRTIIGQSGAESLLGKGDMLYLASNSSIPIRVHGAFVNDQEISSVVNFWKSRSICYK